jgi:hypothetical protein
MPWYAHMCSAQFYIIKDLLLICNWLRKILVNSLRIKEELQMDCPWQECHFSRQLLQQEQALCECNLLLVPSLKKFFEFQVEIKLAIRTVALTVYLNEMFLKLKKWDGWAIVYFEFFYCAAKFNFQKSKAEIYCILDLLLPYCLKFCLRMYLLRVKRVLLLIFLGVFIQVLVGTETAAWFFLSR